MFFTEEDVEPAVKTTAHMFGPIGSIVVDTTTTVLYGVSIATREFGKLWYGDIRVESSDNLINKLNVLSRSINKQVYILDDGYDFIKPLFKSI